ncbi:MAG TPA: hypothetical protein PLE60_15100 [Candidatus Latescibacteria bacterium]|nr:hypothetical protein [Candidatus Latescibacterota bacterium]
MGEIVSVSTAAHWYAPDGNPNHGATLREARKELLLGSITSIIRTMAKPVLEAWKIEQAIISALTLPRIKGESYTDLAKRIAKDAQDEAGKAADLGSAVHAAIEQYAKGGSPERDDKIMAIAAPAITWLSEAVETYCMVEQPLADPAEGFGGTLDLYFKTKAGEYLLADVKTQKTKKDKKIETYPEWCWQLAAQKHLVKRTGGQVTHCINIVLSSTEPGRMEFKTWSDDDIAHGLKVFYALRDVFYLSRKYDYTGAEKIK